MKAPVTFLNFGACLLLRPLEPLWTEGKELVRWNDAPMPHCYTFGIMRQAIATFRGELDIPGEIRPLCGVDAAAGPLPGAADFEGLDVALIEPASAIEIDFRGYSLNRIEVYNRIIAPIRLLSTEANATSMAWFKKGIDGLDQEARAQNAKATIALLPKDFANRELVEAVLRETFTVRSDILQGLSDMRELLGKPLGVVAYVFRYLADGRAVGWPAGFVEEVAAAAERLDLPLLQPAELVRGYPPGVVAALRDDLRHYSAEFLPVMAKHLISFCHAVIDGPSGRAVARE